LKKTVALRESICENMQRIERLEVPLMKFAYPILAISVISAFVVPFLPLPINGQFPAESTIPMKQRKGRKIAKGPDGPTPRTKDGKPDLTAVWGYAGYTSDIAKDYDVGQVPMTKLGESLFLERQGNQGRDDPEARCLPTGVPRRDPYPSKIIQTDGVVVILYEGNIHSYRQIFMNQEHPKDLAPTWYGHSVGKWEGDELVVDTIGFNGLTWLDLAGHPASDQLHVIERFSRPNYGNLLNHITIIDPVMYSKPLEIMQWTPLESTGEIMEYICTENERDAKHLDNLKK
jgi:hypothetical protein